MALMPTGRMGPPPGALPPMRMIASWSGSKRTYRIQVCGTKMRPIASSPSDPPRSDTQPPTRHEAMQKARLAVHRRSACSGVKALRNTSHARRHAAKLCYRFGPLTPSARSANLIAGDGTKNGFPGRVEDWRASWPGYPDRATFPAPSTSHAACGFPALRAPICFTSGLMGPIMPGQLSVRRVALDSC
jgi:hypothetical protein